MSDYDWTVNGTDDMVLRQFTELNILGTDTVTTASPCRGMFIYVQGDCTIAGHLHMDGKGAAGNPANAGGSDSNVVNASGIQLGMKVSGGSDESFTNDGTRFNGCGTAVRAAVANQYDLSASFAGTIFGINRTGAAGGIAVAGVAYDPGNQTVGSAGAVSDFNATTGGGGTGGWVEQNSGANGGAGTCFSGGSGSSGGIGISALAEAGDAYGGAGGTCASFSARHGAGGGGGDPEGSLVTGSSAFVQSGTDPGNGGGVIWLVVGGDLTISGTISADGGPGMSIAGNVSPLRGVGGGGTGGGSIIILYAGTLSNSGTVRAAAGSGGGCSGGGDSNTNGAAGGAGTTQIVQVSAAS